MCSMIGMCSRMCIVVFKDWYVFTDVHSCVQGLVYVHGLVYVLEVHNCAQGLVYVHGLVYVLKDWYMFTDVHSCVHGLVCAQ
jgi:hypothetical protein